MRNKYYLEIITNAENHFTKLPKNNNKYNYIISAKIRNGNPPNSSKMQFARRQIFNGWYENLFVKSQIDYIPITFNVQSEITFENLKEILYRDFFQSDNSRNNNVYFKNVILLNIEQIDGEYILQIANIKQNDYNKIYAIVEETKICNGIFKNSNPKTYKTYSIEQLNNNILYFNSNYNCNNIGSNIKSETINYNSNFYNTETGDTEQTEAYLIKSTGCSKKILFEHIYDSYAEAKQNLPKNQTYHWDYIEKQKLNTISYKQIIEYKNTTNEITLMRVNELQQNNTFYERKYVKKIGIYQHNNGIVTFDISQHKTSDEIENGYWFIMDTLNNYFYDGGFIENNQLLNICDILTVFMKKDSFIELVCIEKNLQYNMVENDLAHVCELHNIFNKLKYISNSGNIINYNNDPIFSQIENVSSIQNPYITFNNIYCSCNNPFTINIQLYITQHEQQIQLINWDNYLYLLLNADNQINIQVNNSIILSSSVISKGWNNITLTYQNNTLKLYTNKQQCKQTNFELNNNNKNYTVVIGDGQKINIYSCSFFFKCINEIEKTFTEKETDINLIEEFEKISELQHEIIYQIQSCFLTKNKMQHKTKEILLNYTPTDQFTTIETENNILKKTIIPLGRIKSQNV